MESGNYKTYMKLVVLCKQFINLIFLFIIKDDWYYLNMANTPKVNDNSNTATSSKVDDNSTMANTSEVDDNLNTATSLKVDENSTIATIPKEDDERTENSPAVEKDVESDQGLPNQESEVETTKPKRRKKRRRIPWSRHAIRGTRVSKNVKTKLQGKIVKGGVKNVTDDIQDTTRKSHGIHKKAENVDLSTVKENTNNTPKTSILDKTSKSII